MKYKIIYSPEAVDDLRNIYSYISAELQEPSIAKNQVDMIRQSIKSLDEMPERHMKVEWEPWNSMGMRKFPVSNYVFFYYVDNEDNSVSIARIFYSGRDVENIIQSSGDY